MSPQYFVMLYLYRRTSYGACLKSPAILLYKYSFLVANIHYSVYKTRVCCVKVSRAVDASTWLGATDNMVAMSTFLTVWMTPCIYLHDKWQQLVYNSCWVRHGTLCSSNVINPNGPPLILAYCSSSAKVQMLSSSSSSSSLTAAAAARWRCHVNVSKPKIL